MDDFGFGYVKIKRPNRVVRAWRYLSTQPWVVYRSDLVSGHEARRVARREYVRWVAWRVCAAAIGGLATALLAWACFMLLWT